MKKGPLSSLILVVFVDLVGFGVIIPLLPLYARTFNAGAIEVGFLMACFSLGQFVAAPFLGGLSDRHGRRPVLIFSLGMSAVAYTVFGLGESLLVLFLARTVAGLCGGNIAAAQAYIADVTTPDERARAMGLLGMAFGMGFVLGPAIGGFMAEISPSAPFFFAAGMSLVAALLCYFRLPEPEKRHKTVSRRGSIGLLKESPPLLTLVAIFFIVTAAFTHLEVSFTLYGADRFDLTPAQNALLFTYIGLLIALVQGGLIGPVTKRLGGRKTMLLGIATLATGMSLFPSAPTVPLMMVVLIPISVGSGLVNPSVHALVSLVAPGNAQGRAQGINQAGSSLARILGPVSGGILYEAVGISSPFWTAALLLCLGLGLALRFGGLMAEAKAV